MGIAALFAAATAFSSSAAAPITVDGVLCHPSRLCVRTEDLAKVDSPSVRVLRQFDEIGWTVLEVQNGDLADVYHSLNRKAPVYLDRAAQPAYTPSDPLWANMWNATATNLSQAWDISRGSAVVVAVLDTGVETTHPDLASNIWTNKGEIPGNGIDDDGNGYVDDVNGYDFAYNDAIPNDVYGHGTACSGLVAAVQNNGIGGCGFAPFGKIMALKCAIDSGYFFDSNDTAAFLYALNNGARVLSMSFFSDRVSPMERNALDYCASHGVLPIAAAGNSNSAIPYYPGYYENVLGVGAFGPSGQRNGFSNYGTLVDVSSPGSSLPTVTTGAGYTTGFAGTSGATPQVAGLATLLLGANPSLTTVQARAIIEDTATSWTESPNQCISSYGKINCLAAMQAAQSLSWSGKSPIVRWISPIAGPGSWTMWIQGRLASSPSYSVQVGAGSMNVTAQTRQKVVAIGSGNGAITLKSGATTIYSQAASQITDKTVYPVTEVSSQNASTTGGYAQGLFVDGSYITAKNATPSAVKLECVFQHVSPNQLLTLHVVRGNDTRASWGKVYAYNWSSASYPYGSWIALSSGKATSSTTNDYVLTNSSRFVDDEGAVYIVIDSPKSAGFKIDQMVLLGN